MGNYKTLQLCLHTRVSTVKEAEQEGRVDGPCFAVMELRDKLTSAMRGLHFVNRDKKSLWVCRADQPYCLGWIGYGDYRRGGDGTEMYVVHARTISNGKYGDHNEQHYMKMSTNIDMALRNCKKFLRVYSPSEIARSRLRDASNAVDTVVSKTKEELSRLHEKVIDAQSSYYRTNHNSALLNELKHLLTTGHEFVDPTFRENLSSYFTTMDEVASLSNRSVPMWFVRVYERMGQQMFDVTAIDKAESAWNATVSDEAERYTAETLPDEIMQKLSVLNILSADDFVDDVGFNAGEGMFYVVR